MARDEEKNTGCFRWWQSSLHKFNTVGHIGVINGGGEKSEKLYLRDCWRCINREVVIAGQDTESNSGKPERNRHGGHEWSRFLGKGSVGMVRARGLGKSDGRSSNEGWWRSRDRRRGHESRASSGEAWVALKHIRIG